MVAGVRINGRATNKEPVSTCNQYTCTRSYAYWGQVCDLPPKQLALTTNSHFMKKPSAEDIAKMNREFFRKELMELVEKKMKTGFSAWCNEPYEVKQDYKTAASIEKCQAELIPPEDFLEVLAWDTELRKQDGDQPFQSRIQGLLIAFRRIKISGQDYPPLTAEQVIKAEKWGKP